MDFLLLSLLTLTSAATTSASEQQLPGQFYQFRPVEVKQASTSDDAQFSSAAAQLISLYIPAPVESAIYSAATFASVTGAPAQVIESALTATSNPLWFSAIPSQYSANIASLDSAISELRVAAASGIPGADRVSTSTDGAGSVVVVTSTGSAHGSGASSTDSESLNTALTTAAPSSSSGATVPNSSLSSFMSVVSSLAAGGEATSSTSAGAAAPTKGPSVGAVAVLGIGALGVVGMLGC
ncbi:hypothetical protein K402DRAFT_467793 [Aulographum hederae CBS 113979]|uniref:Uncharacterized protein n=1 Tax=Aulographum hederae CBS 113979 TaxID=1176131 RepID=A0A6G1GJT7_9PEZI|nr:hypothetical protein K402DRAFT_467793 [Aulographum hederae CBS 113979]